MRDESSKPVRSFYQRSVVCLTAIVKLLSSSPVEFPPLILPDTQVECSTVSTSLML